jgi:hypothetical protein
MTVHQIAPPTKKPNGVNVYRQNFTGRCPFNGEDVAYHLRIESPTTIHAEHITFAIKCAFLEGAGLHEEIADALHAKVGGRQRISAWHQGVHILTVRG